MYVILRDNNTKKVNDCMLEHSEQAKKLYDSKQWKLTREAYLDSVDWHCERCGDAAYIVHHVKHIDITNIDDPTVTLNHNNLEALCISCHNKEHFQTNHETVSGVSFNQYGELVQIKS